MFLVIIGKGFEYKPKLPFIIRQLIEFQQQLSRPVNIIIYSFI